MSVRAYVLMMILFAIVVASFSYLRVLTHRIFLEAWPPREEAVRARLDEAALQPPSGPSQAVTLYFLSLDMEQLHEEKRQMPLAADDTDRIRQILLALIEGSHLGYGRALPPSTEIRGVFLTPDGTAYVDFSSEVLGNFSPGIATEILTVYSFVNSLAANIPAVKRVKILIQGQEVDTLNGHVDLTDFFVPDPARNVPGS